MCRCATEFFTMFFYEIFHITGNTTERRFFFMRRKYTFNDVLSFGTFILSLLSFIFNYR